MDFFLKYTKLVQQGAKMMIRKERRTATDSPVDESQNNDDLELNQDASMMDGAEMDVDEDE